MADELAQGMLGQGAIPDSWRVSLVDLYQALDRHAPQAPEAITVYKPISMPWVPYYMLIKQLFQSRDQTVHYVRPRCSRRQGIRRARYITYVSAVNAIGHIHREMPVPVDFWFADPDIIALAYNIPQATTLAWWAKYQARLT
jgi:hypothetical protein